MKSEIYMLYIHEDGWRLTSVEWDEDFVWELKERKVDDQKQSKKIMGACESVDYTYLHKHRVSVHRIFFCTNMNKQK